MSEATICPWCQTEIVWDEELGPEPYCPHCDNELTGYRTISLDVDGPDNGDEADAEEDRGRRTVDDGDGFRRADARLMSIGDKVDRIVDGQEEAPECPLCRTYMMEAGSQPGGGEGYEPSVPETLGKAFLPGPFRVVWFVCPSCFTVQQRLSEQDRHFMLKRLAEE